MFTCNLDKIEVYDVGKTQLLSWISSGSVDNPVYAAYPVVIGDYVIVQLTSTFGHMRTTPLVFTGYLNMLDAMSKMPSQVEFRNPDKPWTVGYATIQEIWHVVDDDDLWGAWESKVICAKVNDWYTGFLLYDGRHAVLRYRRGVPDVIYSVVTLHPDGETYLDVDYYDDATGFGDAISSALTDGCDLQSIDEHKAQELGLYFLDDNGHDDSLAYGLPVVVAYMRCVDES